MTLTVAPALAVSGSTDVHLGSDLNDCTDNVTRRSDDIDRDLALLLSHYRAAPPPADRWHIVIAGDFIDFIGITLASNRERLETEPTVEERMQLISASLKGRERVEVSSFKGLTVEYARSRGATTLVKGLRAYSDFDAELQQALMNRKLAPDIHTVFLMSSFAHIYVSSTILKDIASYGGNVSDLVPPPVARALKEKYR